MMVLPNTELGSLWWVILLLFTFESAVPGDILQKGVVDIQGGLEGPFSLKFSRC